MEWNELEPIWKTCFELAWESHLEGSNPIAAVIVDAGSKVVATGKSAVKAALSGVPSSNCEIAHAEVNALLGLDNRVHDKAKARGYTLYVTLEPCPMCFSALYMSDVKKLVFAARDRFGGSTNLLGATPYLSKKPTQIAGPIGQLEDVSIFLNAYCNVLRGVSLPDVVHEELAVDYPKVVRLAERLALGDSLGIAEEPQFSRVYHKILPEIRGLDI